ncbi:hypothetical protein D3C87_1098920 [compost metagenome]
MRIAEAVHRLRRIVETVQFADADALDEFLPLPGVIGLVQFHQRLLDLFRAAFQGQVILRRRLEHPVGALQFAVGRFLECLLDVFFPGVAREGAGDGVAAQHQFLVLLADDACHRHRRETRGGARLHVRIHAVARRHAAHHAAQAVARLVGQGPLVFDLRPGRVVDLRQVERDQALGAADHLFARHVAPVGVEPAAPVAGQLVVQVTGLGARLVAQHQVGFQGIVGIFHVRRRGILEGLACGAGRRADCGGGRRAGRHCRQRLQPVGARVHFREERFQRLRHRREHDFLEAGKILFAQFAFQQVTLVQAQAERQRPLAAVRFQLLDAVLQDFQGLEARLQVQPLVLHLDGLLQVGLDIGRQLAVGQVGPAPAAQRQAGQRDGGEKRGIAQARLAWTGVLRHQLPVGEDHLAKQVQQEVAVLVLHLDRLVFLLLRFEVEALRHPFRRGGDGSAFLQGAGEIEAAEDGLELERVFLEQRGDEGAQRPLHGTEFQREGEDAGRHALASQQRHVGQAEVLQAIVQLVEALVELLQHVLLRAVDAVGQGGAPDLVAFAALGIVEKFAEAGDQVGLGEYHVHGRMDFQLLRQLLYALAQVLGQFDGEFGLAAGQLGNADGDDDAVDRRALAVFFQQGEEAEPFGAVFIADGVAPGRIEQDAVGGEKPVAVAGAAHALHDLAVDKRKLQARIGDRRALAGGGIADDHIPGQFIQRRIARQLAQARRLDGIDRFQHALADGFGFLALHQAGLGRGAGRLLLEHAVEAGALAPAPAASQPPHDDAQQRRRSQQGQQPGGRPVENDGAGEQQQDGGRDAEDEQAGA